ncbi:hypothetical protein TNCV_5025691 [Trichonephila clavipes]|nr:hypothetical protein TNCV_5025691 [Trichonephila clavipes]
MENKTKEISTSDRKINVKRWKIHRDIARSVGRQYSSIQHVIYNFKSTAAYISKPLLSPLSKLIIREKRRKEKNTTKNYSLKDVTFTELNIPTPRPYGKEAREKPPKWKNLPAWFP